jgi:hypothetical protein
MNHATRHRHTACLPHRDRTYVHTCNRCKTEKLKGCASESHVKWSPVILISGSRRAQHVLDNGLNPLMREQVWSVMCRLRTLLSSMDMSAIFIERAGTTCRYPPHTPSRQCQFPLPRALAEYCPHWRGGRIPDTHLCAPIVQLPFTDHVAIMMLIVPMCLLFRPL